MRLIDADSLFVNMDKGIQGTAREYLKFYQMAVSEQPTAYDVDKVVEKLERLSNDVISNIFCYEEDDHTGIYNDGLSDGYEKSVEIVKSGGLE